MAQATTPPTEQPYLKTYASRTHPKQVAFHHARGKYRFRAFVGGVQSGKSEGGAAEDAVYSLAIAPGQTGAIFAPDYPRSIILRERFERFVPYELRQWNGTDRYWTVTGDGGAQARIYLRNADPDGLRGLTLRWAHVDEAAFCSESFFDNLQGRLTVLTGDLWTTTTPVGQNWHHRWSEGPDVYTVRCASHENPAFGRAEYERIGKRYGFDSAFFRQEYDGIAAAFVGMALPRLDPETLIQPVAWHDEHQTVCAIDPGWTAGTGALLAQISPDEVLTIWGWRYWTETERHLVLFDLTWPHVRDQTRVTYAIDPAGSSARAPEAGDIGWQQAIEDMVRGPDGSTLIDVRWNRMVGESAGLMIVRQLIEQGRFRIAKDAFVKAHGQLYPGADEIKRLLLEAKLSSNIEKDEMAEQHPHAELVDCTRYIGANFFEHLQRRPAASAAHRQ